MIPKPAIRRFDPRDLAAVLRIERASFGRDAWPRELFEDYASSGALFLVARVSGVAAGYSIVSFGRHGAELASLAVLPRFRGRGVASALARASIQRVRRMEAPAIWLMVRRTNLDAISLYRKLGFARVATVPGYYGGRSTGWRMRLNLSKESD